MRNLLSDLAALFEAQRPAGVQVNFILPEPELLVRAQPLRLMLALWQLLELLSERLTLSGGGVAGSDALRGSMVSACCWRTTHHAPEDLVPTATVCPSTACGSRTKPPNWGCRWCRTSSTNTAD